MMKQPLEDFYILDINWINSWKKYSQYNSAILNLNDIKENLDDEEKFKKEIKERCDNMILTGEINNSEEKTSLLSGDKTAVKDDTKDEGSGTTPDTPDSKKETPGDIVTTPSVPPDTTTAEVAIPDVSYQIPSDDSSLPAYSVS